MHHRFFRRRGFTLVELMVVVAVIGVGGTLAVVNMSDQVAEARARADAQAMVQRIRQEHREAKERMTGLVLHATGSTVAGGGGGGGGELKNVLVFRDAHNCVPFGDERTSTFFSTTGLEVTGSGTVCWNDHGEPADGREPVDGSSGGMVSPPRGLRDDPVGPVSPTPLPPELVQAEMNTMSIVAGIKRPRRLPIYMSMTGVTAIPPIKAANAAGDKTTGYDPKSGVNEVDLAPPQLDPI